MPYDTQYSIFRSDGNFNQAYSDTSSVIVPPNNTDGTVPIAEAANPLSNCPNSLLLLINTEFTAETRPRICSGTII